MSTPEPPCAQRRNRIVLPAKGPRGFTTGAVTKLPDGRIEFDPTASGAGTFTMEEDELIKALLSWGLG
jgi:hypothetical protein